jgi:hypothetical protein
MNVGIHLRKPLANLIRFYPQIDLEGLGERGTPFLGNNVPITTSNKIPVKEGRPSGTTSPSLLAIRFMNIRLDIIALPHGIEKDVTLEINRTPVNSLRSAPGFFWENR